jgi:hypothetical protein
LKPQFKVQFQTLRIIKSISYKKIFKNGFITLCILNSLTGYLYRLPLRRPPEDEAAADDDPPGRRPPDDEAAAAEDPPFPDDAAAADDPPLPEDEAAAEEDPPPLFLLGLPFNPPLIGPPKILRPTSPGRPTSPCPSTDISNRSVKTNKI